MLAVTADRPPVCSLAHAALRAPAGAGLPVDRNGRLAFANRLHPAAVASLKAHRDRVATVSNNSPDLPGDFRKTLARAGIVFPEERIVLTGAQPCAQRSSLSAFALASRKMPARVRRHLGLDAARCWISLATLNRFVWPGPDLRAIPGRAPSSAAYGFIPQRLLDITKSLVMTELSKRIPGLIVRRSEE